MIYVSSFKYLLYNKGHTQRFQEFDNQALEHETIKPDIQSTDYEGWQARRNYLVWEKSVIHNTLHNLESN